MTSFSLKGKVALVTGAAYGIGFAIAEAFAEAGARIAFNCRSQEHLDRALADYKAAGIDARGLVICQCPVQVLLRTAVERYPGARLCERFSNREPYAVRCSRNQGDFAFQRKTCHSVKYRLSNTTSGCLHTPSRQP